MASLNKVMLIGSLGKDVNLRYTTGGQPVASFSLATDESFKNKAGEWEERTEWHNITIWGKLAEIANEHLSKGTLVYLEGSLQTRKWQDKSGNDRYSTDIVCNKMQKLSSSSGSSGKAPADSGHDQQSPPDDDIPY